MTVDSHRRSGPRPGAADGLPRSTPRSQGVDADGVAAFVDALEADPGIEPHSLMLLRHGHVVAEGWWRPYAPDGRQLLYSLSKSFTATALGLAVDEGLVSLDDTVLSHFPELDADVTDPRSRRMLVRHVASMASGHTAETIERAEAADPQDLVRGFLLTPPEAEPGSVFAYNQPCTFTVGAIVARRSGQSLTEYLRPRLLDPLGIGTVGWKRDRSGRELGYSGLHATTDAVARLGLLYLRRGVWDGRRILPEDWVEQATSPQVDNAGFSTSPDWGLGYGFQFWQSQHGYRGDGAYGQFCVVLPEHDAVLAVTAATVDMQGVLDAAYRHLLPALGGDASGTGAAEPGDGSPGGSGDGPTGDRADAADARLADRLAGLALEPVTGADRPPAGSERGWDGFTAQPAAGPLAAVSVAEGDGGWAVTVESRHPGDRGAPLRLALGGEGWAVQDCSLPDGGAVPVAVSGGWDDGDTLDVDVLFLQTPHRLRLRCSLPDGAATATWLTEPLGGPPLRDLRSPEE